MRPPRWLFREGALVVGLAAIALALLPGARGREARLAFGEEPLALPTVELTIDEDRLAALEAGRPRGVRCARPRGADVPVRSVRVNGRELEGSFRARYRGRCREHWGAASPSLTIESEDRGRILGRRSLDLNSLESDAELYDAWVGRMAHLIHAPATRTAFLHLSINGRDAGTRVVVENLDDELFDTQGLVRGAVFRERILAEIGVPWSMDALRNVYRVRADPAPDWGALHRFHHAVHDAEPGRADLHAVLDLQRYVDYLALVILSGTEHASDHNTPLFLARGSRRVVLIVDDFSRDEAGARSVLLEELQSSLVSQNRLSHVLLADPAFRRRVHSRTAELVSHFDFSVLHRRYLEAVRSLGRDLENVRADGVARRLAFITRGYLDPIAHVTAEGREVGGVQLAIDGLGAYRIRFGQCGDDVPVLVNARRVQARCRDGRLVIVAERWEVPSTGAGAVRNPAGAVIVTFDGRVATLGPFEVTSLATDEAVLVRDDWPFFLETAGAGRVRLGTDAPPSEIRSGAEGWSLFVPDGARAEIDHGSIEVGESGETRQPAICWRAGGRAMCHELSLRWQGRRPDPVAQADAIPGRTITAAEAARCQSRRVFTGTWFVAEGVAFGAECEVRFEDDAILLFAPSAYLVAEGRVLFPDDGRVFFLPVGETWGGVALLEPARVVNARFEGASGFEHAGVRYDAALTLTAGGAVRSSRFAHNEAEDALNVRGGSVVVTDSLFDDNGDAIDLDGASGRIERTLIVDAHNDGIDLGGSRATIRNVVVLRAGDKAVSIGDGSHVRLESCVLRESTIGVAVKDESRVVFDRTAILENRVGVWLDHATRANASSGSVVFAQNRRDGRPDLDEGLAQFGEDALATVRRVVRACPVCQRFARDDEQPVSHVP